MRRYVCVRACATYWRTRAAATGTATGRSACDQLSPDTRRRLVSAISQYSRRRRLVCTPRPPSCPVVGQCERKTRLESKKKKNQPRHFTLNFIDLRKILIISYSRAFSIIVRVSRYFPFATRRKTNGSSARAAFPAPSPTLPPASRPEEEKKSLGKKRPNGLKQSAAQQQKHRETAVEPIGRLRFGR